MSSLSCCRSWSGGFITVALGIILSACHPKGPSETPHPPAGETPASTAGETLAPTANPRTLAQTAYEHAQACEAQLGPIPTFDLTTAIEIPVEQNGVPVGDAEVFECDHPAAFQAPCEPGLLGRLQGSQLNGAADPDVVWTYIYRSGGFAAIGYHAGSGATCFLEIDDLPNPTLLESPLTVGPNAYNAQWTSPREMFEVSRCQDCHMADPFLHSPYIDQVRDPVNTDKTLIPVIAGATNPSPPYQIISSSVAPYTTELPDNSCTTCHRPQCTTLFDGQNGYMLDELAMPAPFHDLSTWDDPASVAVREAVRDWCNTLVPFGPQLGGANGGDDEDTDDEDNGPCDIAFECVSECVTTDYGCALACGNTHLTAVSGTTFAALVNCAEASLCEMPDLECLDSSCQAEFDAFIATCEEE